MIWNTLKMPTHLCKSGLPSFSHFSTPVTHDFFKSYNFWTVVFKIKMKCLMYHKRSWVVWSFQPYFTLFSPFILQLQPWCLSPLCMHFLWLRIVLFLPSSHYCILILSSSLFTQKKCSCPFNFVTACYVLMESYSIAFITYKYTAFYT